MWIFLSGSTLPSRHRSWKSTWGTFFPNLALLAGNQTWQWKILHLYVDIKIIYIYNYIYTLLEGYPIPNSQVDSILGER